MNKDYTKAITELLHEMEEEKQKALYEFIVAMNTEKGEEQNQEQNQKEIIDIYNSNEVMKMIGKQNIAKYIDNEKINKDMQDIVKAHNYDIHDIFDVMLDMFIYGCIVGKKEVRENKKATNPTAK